MTMRFEHEFTVPVPIEQAWSVLLDVERVAPCLPGATLDTVDGDTLTGRMKVKVGPITVTYRGKASFESVDKDAHALSIKASGKEARGTGTANAVVSAALTGEGAHTKVTVETSFNVTGRPAQFGRGVMAEVGAKLIDRFAANLAALLRETPEELSATAVSEGAVPPLSAEPAPTPFNQAAASPLGEPTTPEIIEPLPAGEPLETAEPATIGEPGESGEPVRSGTPVEAREPIETGQPVLSGEPVETDRPLEVVEHVEAAQTDRPLEAVPNVEAAQADEAAQTTQAAQPERHLTAVPDSYDAPYAEEAAGREAHPAGTARTSRTADEEALDLLEIAGLPLLKRVAPVVAALALVILIGWLVRRVVTRR
ncbi:SRPBCC domain-containing protein [Sphaerisporangium viridialbum]|uniref:SRPBCC family protein n=1 Tax=Sphaerisporangium viridialbum TaxID=46189 RepID=UPI003C7640B9